MTMFSIFQKLSAISVHLYSHLDLTDYIFENNATSGIKDGALAVWYYSNVTIVNTNFVSCSAEAGVFGLSVASGMDAGDPSFIDGHLYPFYWLHQNKCQFFFQSSKIKTKNIN